MLRHLKNANELVLYASVSCATAFIGRIFPAFFFPILLLRMSVTGYCIIVIAKAEGNRELATILLGAVFVGFVGGYWDAIELYLKFDAARVGLMMSIAMLVLLSIIAFVTYRKGGTNGKARTK